MKNKEWLTEFYDLHAEESVYDEKKNRKELQELEALLDAAAIKKKKEEPQSLWDRLQDIKKHNQENNITTQNNPRQFNQKSYDDNDKVAKDLMINFLQKKGHVITQSEETYSTDIITNKGKYEVEISSKDFTTRESFPYPMVNFLGRKEKYGDMYYVIISKNHQYALVAAAKDIFKPENKTVVYCNTQRQGLDEVYQLPSAQVKFFKL
jgi:DNA gyrase/topoisomerase IV subunit A